MPQLAFRPGWEPPDRPTLLPALPRLLLEARRAWAEGRPWELDRSDMDPPLLPAEPAAAALFAPEVELASEAQDDCDRDAVWAAVADAVPLPAELFCRLCE